MEDDKLQSQPQALDDNEVDSLEDTIEQTIGYFSWTQFIQAILVALASIFDSQQSFINVYTDNDPPWNCIDTGTCHSNSDICHLPNSSWSWTHSSQSIISNWGLQCSSAFIRSLPASSHFAGCLLGIFFMSTLADSSLGRKNLLLVSCSVMSACSSIIVLSRNIWIYSFLRFLTGLARASIGTCTIVLITEKIGTKWRGLSSVFDAAFFVVGTLSLPMIANYINDGHSWRFMYLWTSIPLMVYCVILYFFVTESPRWLFMQGRVEEAIKILKYLSPKKEVMIKLKRIDELDTRVQQAWKFNFLSSMSDLFSRKWIRIRTLAIMVIGFGIGTVYYGMTIDNGNMGVIFNGLSEIPAVLIIFFLIRSLNRRSSILFMCVTSGVFCILSVVLYKGEIVEKGLKFGSLFGACTAFNVMMIYTVELFPTCVRNSATSMYKQAINFGAIFSTVLVSFEKRNRLLLGVVFGLVIICCGFSVMFLPETKDKALYDTIDEQEVKENGSV